MTQPKTAAADAGLKPDLASYEALKCYNGAMGEVARQMGMTPYGVRKLILPVKYRLPKGAKSVQKFNRVVARVLAMYQGRAST